MAEASQRLCWEPIFALAEPFLECEDFLATAYSVVLFSLLSIFESCEANLLMQEKGCMQSESEGILWNSKINVLGEGDIKVIPLSLVLL